MTDRDLSLKKWIWPQFSLRTSLLVMTAYAICVGLAAKYGDADELICSAIGGIVLIWALLCWTAVRLNHGFFKASRFGAPIISLLIGESLGLFLSFTAWAMAGFGHGSLWPSVIFSGVFFNVMLYVFDHLRTENALVLILIGAAPYAVYGLAILFGYRRNVARGTAVGILLIHYISVVVAAFFGRASLESDPSGIAKVWTYLPGSLISGFGVFIAAQLLLLRTAFRSNDNAF